MRDSLFIEIQQPVMTHDHATYIQSVKHIHQYTTILKLLCGYERSINVCIIYNIIYNMLMVTSPSMVH